MEKFTLDDVGLLLRHRRQATIARLFDIGVTDKDAGPWCPKRSG